MAKKATKKTTDKKRKNNDKPTLPKMSPEMEKKYAKLKSKLDKFEKKVVEKFGDYIMGIAIMPPAKPKPAHPGAPKASAKEEKKPNPDRVDLIVIVDDTTSKKMNKDELHKKFSTIIDKIAEEIDKNLYTQSVLLTDIWQNCYDGKHDLNKLIAMSTVIYDTGMLSAIKISEIHKSMVIKKFEKYIVSYVLGGSLTQGRATPSSDIDVWIVIDDTDVKKMSRAELKDKLRGIIISMGIEAGELTGIKNKLNIQCWILTEYWDALKEANPVMFTLLRDGVPFYDRGMFMPWKQLLRMGKIKPSRESIDMFMDSGRKMIKRVEYDMKRIGMDDLFYAVLTPSQAALMLYGVAPPTPRETVEIMEDVFVKKEKLLEKKYVDILKGHIKVRKELEHGSRKEISGKEIDAMIKDTKDFMNRIEKLFEQIEEQHNAKTIDHLYDEVLTISRDILRGEGFDKIKDTEVIKKFEDELVSTGKIPKKFLSDLEEIVSAKKKFDQGKLNKVEIEKARKSSIGLIRYLVEYMQRKRGRSLERAKIRVKHGKKFGEITLLGKEGFVIMDIDARENLEIFKGPIDEKGSLGALSKSNLEEFEAALAKANFSERVFIKEAIFEDLKKIFGRDVEVLLHY